MSRGLWFVAGAASGVYAIAKVRRTARAFTPEGIGARIAALRAGASVFAGSVAEGMAEREADLRLQIDRSAQPPRLLGAAAPRTAESSDTESREPSLSTTDLEGSAYGHR
jgi:uncharacterized protein DUF6167